MRWAFVVAAMICSCGARSEITGTGIGFDATMPSVDAAITADASSGDAIAVGDGGLDATTCTAAVVNVGCGNTKCQNCKFDVEWTCGDVKYRIGGSCDPSSLFPDAGFIQGVCDEDGKQSSTFKVPAATCDCTDASALITVVQEKCQHQ